MKFVTLCGFAHLETHERTEIITTCIPYVEPMAIGMLKYGVYSGSTLGLSHFRPKWNIHSVRNECIPRVDVAKGSRLRLYTR